MHWLSGKVLKCFACKCVYHLYSEDTQAIETRSKMWTKCLRQLIGTRPENANVRS